MKIENTLENKARFFDLYRRLKVGHWKDIENDGLFFILECHYTDPDFCLLLTPLSQITDEDAIVVARLFDLGHLSGAVKSLVESLLESLDNNSQATTMFIKSWIKVVDYLRSRGYYVGDGTEIEYGWVKLKEVTND